MRALVFVVAILAVGCKTKSEGALEKFANKYSCPADQVTVTPRPDLDAFDELGPQLDDVKPSAEVAADPARLAKWTADEDAKRESWRSGYGDYEMFAVSGCGHAMTYGCHHPAGVRGGSRPDRVSCDESRTEHDREKAEDKAARRRARDAAKAAKKAGSAAP